MEIKVLNTISILSDIIKERRRQINEEGFDYSHDDQHTDGSLAQAGSAYAWPQFEVVNISAGMHFAPTNWPKSWNDNWYKPLTRKRDLIKAAALIVAELERLERLERKEK